MGNGDGRQLLRALVQTRGNAGDVHAGPVSSTKPPSLPKIKALRGNRGTSKSKKGFSLRATMMMEWSISHVRKG